MILVGFLLCLSTQPGSAQERTSGDRVDSTRHPNQTPYTTDRGISYHVLATPAYLLHAATRPIGWVVKYTERRFPALFDGELPTRGGLPLVEFGGPAGRMAGAMLYDNNLFGTGRRLRVEGLYGARNAFRLNGRYQSSAPFGRHTGLSVRVHFFSDPQREYFLGGNDSDRDADRAYFQRQQFDVEVAGRYEPDGLLGGQVGIQYEHIDPDRAEGDRGDRLVESGLPGLEPAHLLSPQLTLGLGRTNGRPRTHVGTELLLQLGYTHDVLGERFRYGRYAVGFRQYVPLTGPPLSRRLILRAHFEQVTPMFGGDAVPFYHRPGLGGQTSLRGFRHHRFQDEGSLVLTAEYRYPVWDVLDAALFVDAGQVFPDITAIGADRFHWSYGGGLQVLNRDGISMRFELAGGTEGLRTILTVEPTFRRVSR